VNDGKLTGRVALVTGAGKRIGRCIALEFAARGLDVAVNYRSSRAEAEAVAAEIEKKGRSALVVQADVSKRADVERMIAETERAFGCLKMCRLSNSRMSNGTAYWRRI
jgi:3-oxoacyl-[acyl-carrier protein] reductase